MTPLTFDVIKVFTLAAATCTVAILWSPILTHYLYKHKLWKKSARQKAISGEDAVVFSSLHKEKETGAPRMGGLLVWVTVVLVTIIFYFTPFNFLSRSQTWLPLFTLVVASVVGFRCHITTVIQLFLY